MRYNPIYSPHPCLICYVIMVSCNDSAQLLFVDGRILGGLVDITLPRFSSSLLYSWVRAVLVGFMQVGASKFSFVVVTKVMQFCGTNLYIYIRILIYRWH